MLVGLIALAAVFLVCAWSGRTLALHHQDGREVAAVVAIGACVLLSLAFGRQLLESHGSLPLFGLALVAAGGLFVGYDRADRLR